MTETLTVERYDLQRASDCLDCETEIGRDLGGDYVLYDDYWALAQELATLRAQLAGVRQSLSLVERHSFDASTDGVKLERVVKDVLAALDGAT